MSLEFSSDSIICNLVLIDFYRKWMCKNYLIKIKPNFSFGMKVELLFFMSVITWCAGVRLSPMENNDKLQDVTSLYVAEWQWESWPVKQEINEQEGRTPGQRKNVALWRDSLKSAWYLFGGQPINGDSKKVYTDIWKFAVKTRVWKRVFPSQGELKETYLNKKGVGVNLGLNQQSNASFFDPASHRVVLCGGLEKKNLTSSRKQNLWNSFKGKKFKEEKMDDELLYLATYAPKSNVVKRIDMKNKFWMTYVCYRNTTQNEIDFKTFNSSSRLKEKIQNLKKDSITAVSATKNESSVFDSKINKAEDTAESEQHHLKISIIKNKKKKINQMRKTNEKSHLKQIKIEKKAGGKEEKNINKTKLSVQGEDIDSKRKYNERENDTEIGTEKENEEHISIPKVASGSSEKKAPTEKSGKVMNIKITAKDCPDFPDGGKSVTWCDGRNMAFITAEISSPQMILQVFNLTTGQWSQLEVTNDGGEWEDCTNKDSVRYAGNEEEVYIICSESNKFSQNSNQTNPSEIPSEPSFNSKQVYKFNYKELKLRSLGKILMNPYFNSMEGEKVWRNDTQSVLEVLKNSENETILILAYLDMIDLWILNKNQENKESFEFTEKIWRGSALKWFDKYNAALYSLQFVSESENSETILLLNPRNIEANDYWPRERGRFIIRIFRNENLKNQSFENRTRDQNLTYELLQSDYKPSGDEHQLNQMYSSKVFVFFGISLAIFTIFGFVVFLKRCVSCPPRIRIRNEYHKSPLIIRYSVIPDDLLYPVA